MKNDTKKGSVISAVVEAIQQVQNHSQNGSLVVSVVLERKTFNKEGDDIPYVAVSVYSKDRGLDCFIPSRNFSMIEKDYFNYILKEKSKLEIESILYVEKKQFTNDNGDLVVYFDYFIVNDYFRKLKLDKTSLSYREHAFLRSYTD